VPCETVVLMPRQLDAAGNADVVADTLAPILDLDRNNILKKAEFDGKTEQRLLKRQITREEADAIRKLNFRGVGLVPDRKRVYPSRKLFGRVLGYTNVDGDGQDGLELYYNKYLKGKSGKLSSEVTASRETLPFGSEYIEAPVPGQNARLTVDEVMQSFCEQAMDEAYAMYQPLYASVIMMDVKTGGILASAVTPSMDLNDPPRHDLPELRKLSRNSQFQDNYDPGSTFKVITTAAALEEGDCSLTEHFNCGGGRDVLGTKIHCWRRGNPHPGDQTIRDAVRNSCNPVFIDLARRLGRDKFYGYLDKFGFGRPTGLDFPGEAKGIITPVQYVTEVDLACMGFGQSVSVTPVQLIAAFSAVVNGGTTVCPHFVSALTEEDGTLITQFDPPPGERVISEETSAVMKEILEYTVREGCKNAYVPGYRVGGKTGTSQKFSEGSLVQGRHVSSFIGFAPVQDPQFAILVIVDEPKTYVDFGSVVAAPWAGKIIGQTLEYLKMPKEPMPGEEDLLKRVVVPDVTLFTVDEAIAAIKNAGLEVYSTGTGTVLEQDPPAGTAVYKNTRIRLIASIPFEEGPEIVPVPDIMGLSMAEAYGKLSRAGLRMKVTGTGVVKGQSVAAGEVVPIGTEIAVDFG
ncbi:MAG: penicillin-binding transpeptidase domain-containing protein, partial [Clostridia bacterium]|nr:penicillin-binding transpeptidase domain-containing protein [Clostridia bacterium]